MKNILIFQTYLSHEHNNAILKSLSKEVDEYSYIYTFGGYPITSIGISEAKTKHINSYAMLSSKVHLKYFLKYPFKYIATIVTFTWYLVSSLLLLPFIKLLLRESNFPSHDSIKFSFLLRLFRIYETYVVTNGSATVKYTYLVIFLKKIIKTIGEALYIKLLICPIKDSRYSLFVSHHNYLGFILYDSLDASYNYTQAAGCIKQINDNLYDEPDAFCISDYPSKINLLDEQFLSISSISKKRDPKANIIKLSNSIYGEYSFLNERKYFVLVLNRLNDSPFYRISDRIFANYFDFAAYTIKFCALNNIPLVVTKHPHASLESYAELRIYNLCKSFKLKNKPIHYHENWDYFLSKNLITLITFDGSVILEALSIGINPITIAVGACKDLFFVHRPKSLKEFNSLLQDKFISTFRVNPTSNPISIYRHITSFSSVGVLKPVHGTFENRDSLRNQNKDICLTSNAPDIIRNTIHDVEGL